jgi:hypothetical protein
MTTENERRAEQLESRAAELDSYVASLPPHVSTEADAEAELLRREARRLRSAPDSN